MFNVTGGEVVIILILALVVLGPDKLPEAMRKFGHFYAEFKKMSSGFQSEMRNALDEPLRELRGTADLAKGIFDQPAEELKKTTDALRGAINSTLNPATPSSTVVPGAAAALSAQQAAAAAAAFAPADVAAETTTAPATDTPDSTVPDSTVPDSATPDSTTPDSTTPDSTTPDSTTPDSSAGAMTFGQSMAAVMREHESQNGDVAATASTTPSTSTSATNTGIDIADKYALDIGELPAEDVAVEEPFDPGPGPNFYSAAPPRLAEHDIIANAGQTPADDGANAE